MGGARVQDKRRCCSTSVCTTRWSPTQVLTGVEIEQVLLFFLLQRCCPLNRRIQSPNRKMMDRMGINIYIQLVVAASGIFVAL